MVAFNVKLFIIEIIYDNNGEMKEARIYDQKIIVLHIVHRKESISPLCARRIYSRRYHVCDGPVISPTATSFSTIQTQHFQNLGNYVQNNVDS